VVSTNIDQFDFIKIGIASPERVLNWSHGEVMKPETINYRTLKPERDGLFCERIFGPSKDWECYCGKYKRVRHRGIVCERCGVEVTESKVRRHRMGHIKLAAPVTHIWFLKGIPSYLGLILDMSLKDLEQVIYFNSYVVLDPGNTELKANQLLSEEEYESILEENEEAQLEVGIGAEAMQVLLNRLNLQEMSDQLKQELEEITGSSQKRVKPLKRLRLVESLIQSGTNPSWMVMDVLPVIPPDLRPMVQLDGGRFATSDLNDLYRRVINRNNRLSRLLEMGAPEIIVRNEKRMLQEAVDALIDNGRRGRTVVGPNNRPLKSLSNIIEGKQGRFRQNLLGKRVDYSGRSVIVVGPRLKLHQCGLPKEMAIELFKPFVINKLIERGESQNIKSAKKTIERQETVVWDVLEEVIKGHPVLLNRAPTLHRLGIQSFEPVLVEGRAIQLHPLVCSAFNADFDGDQMAVHVPLSNASILEAQLLMLGSHNILNPQNGTPITLPSQDMVLGLYYMTKEKRTIGDDKVKGQGLKFYGAEEAMIAYNEGQVELHAPVKCRVRIKEKGQFAIKLIDTTVGRIILNQVMPEQVGFVNKMLGKKQLKDVIGGILAETNIPTTAKFLDDIKKLGFFYSFRGGLSFNLRDVVVPTAKEQLCADAQKKVDEIYESYQEGFITDKERFNQVVDIWTATDSKLTNQLMKQISEDKQGFNSIFMMLDSGARGSKQQIKQLSGMRGLMAKPRKSGSSGSEVIENPILANFKEGLSVLEYFISTHGARKGLSDTALKTADAGYLTRRLVDVAQDVVISNTDCGTLRGITISALKDNEDVVEPLFDRILGRTSLLDVAHPETDELLVEAGEEISEASARLIEESGVESVEIRSVLTCESPQGVCVKCYGRNLATNRTAEEGDAVGIIAAQSIGEPGTQLTLRTFHVGGIATTSATENQLRAKFDGLIQFDGVRTTSSTDDQGEKINVVIGRTGEIRIVKEDNHDKTLISNHIPYGATMFVKDGKHVKRVTLSASGILTTTLLSASMPVRLSSSRLSRILPTAMKWTNKPATARR